MTDVDITNNKYGMLPIKYSHPIACFSLVNRLGYQDKQNTAPLNKPYCDTITVLFPAFTLSMHMYAETH